MKPRLLIPAVLLVLLTGLLMSMSTAPLSGHPQRGTSLFDRLEQPELTHFTLTFNTNHLSEMKYQDEYFPATFTHAGENWDAKIKVRGRYRRRVCDFPPLKLKFSKDMLEAAGLQRHNKFKLVTHCSDNFDGADNVVREQLTYDLYRLMTGEGYRTQLVKVTYRDAATGESTERFGILIEDTTEMAHAHGGDECEDCVNPAAAQFVAGNLEQVALFNYMIGNSDYDTRMMRNVKVVQQRAGGQYKLVPYDFDFSGLVMTEYAKPNVNYGQTSVQDRVWIWDFSTAPQLNNVVADFAAKQDAAFDLVANYPHLSTKSKRQITKFLTEFFTDVTAGNLPV
ncbi:MAG: hypothetical protein AAGJ82_05155 [Bacteroidota bacterium]